MTGRYWRVARLLADLEPWEVLGDRGVEVASPLVDQLQDGDGRERLSDGSGLEQRVEPNRPPGGDLREAVGADRERTVAVGHAEGDPRLVGALHLRPYRRVDARQDGCVDHTAIVVATVSTEL